MNPTHSSSHLRAVVIFLVVLVLGFVAGSYMGTSNFMNSFQKAASIDSKTVTDSKLLQNGTQYRTNTGPCPTGYPPPCEYAPKPVPDGR